MGFISVADLTGMLSACISKLLESLKGEINPTARACAADVLRDILAACYNSGNLIIHLIIFHSASKKKCNNLLKE